MDHDAALDAATEPGSDAAPVTGPDAAADAPPACGIAAVASPALGTANDLASYPTAALIAPGAALGTDGAALTWDAQKLYITVESDAFEGAFEPLHVYLELGTSLAAPAPDTGKEYSGLVPAIPFTPTHLVAVRRQNDSGSGPYDGVYVPGADHQWTTRATALGPTGDVFVSSDGRTISVAVPWDALGGCPTSARVAAHVVHAVPANEWKEVVPATATPWQAPGGDFLTYDLTASSE